MYPYCVFVYQKLFLTNLHFYVHKIRLNISRCLCENGVSPFSVQTRFKSEIVCCSTYHIAVSFLSHLNLCPQTRILVTHAITYLPEADLILVLKDGKISESGTYKQLLAQKGAFADFLVQYLQEAGEDETAEGIAKLYVVTLLGKPRF